MKVYALFINEYEDYALAGVFSSIEKVESVVVKLCQLDDDIVYEVKELTVDSWLLDQFSNLHNLRDVVWKVEMSLDNYNLYDMDTQKIVSIKDGEYTVTTYNNKTIDIPYYRLLTKDVTLANVGHDIKLQINGKANFILAYSYISEEHAIGIAKDGYNFFKTHKLEVN